MQESTRVIVLPVGELDTETVGDEFAAIQDVCTTLGAALSITDPVSDEAGARRLGQKLQGDDADLLLVVTLRGLSAPIIEAAAMVSHTPCLIWPVQGRFALPSSALAIGALRAAGLPVELHYAPPDHPGSIEAVRRIMGAARAYTRLRQSRIGVIGGLFPNLIACRYDPQVVKLKLGATIVPIPFSEVQDMLRSLSDSCAELEQTRSNLLTSYTVDAPDTHLLDQGIKLHLALKWLAQEKRLAGFAAECWSGFPAKLGLNPCLGFVEDAYTLACEGDVMLCLSLLVARYLTGKNVYAGDLYDVSMEGTITLVHCGAPASLAASKKDVQLARSQLATERGFGTMTCRPLLELGPVTVFRWYGRECDKMQVVMGELVQCDRSANMTVKLRLSGSRDDFLQECTGNHYLVVAGDIRKELSLLAKWLGFTLFSTV